MKKTVRELIEDEIKRVFDDTRFENLLLFPPDEEYYGDGYEIGYTLSDVAPFTAWSRTRVYLPVVYDGSYWVRSVPRNPCAEMTSPVGGGK